ncbi:MAG: hypothetical protein IPL01_14425 [Acidobacteria bacterium]|nr:hypothetical protein [Acidobacteriota bacterium]
MNIITLKKPEIDGRNATFRWSVVPEAGLNVRQHFTLTFPESPEFPGFPEFMDLGKVPESLWWRIALICLHSQWPLIRPCRVMLPVRLMPGEAEAWTRLIETEIVSLEAHFGSKGMSRRIEIIEDGPELPPISPIAESESCVMAFSGGKDSMVQMALLDEIGIRPLLVTITSHIPWAHDQITRRRFEVFDEVKRRTGLTLLEVTSDYRDNFKPHVAPSIGIDVPANPITDTLLYFASLLIIGYVLGIPHIVLASEAEIQNTTLIDGEVVQYPDYMYSVVTQASLEAILKPAGIHYTSLISPLHRYQLQTMLWTRYAKLSDLQYSCYKVRPNQMMCNKCVKCMVLAFRTMAAGGEASKMGANWPKLILSMWNWKPKTLKAAEGERLPVDIHFVELDAQISRDIEQVSWEQMARTIMRESPLSFLSGRGFLAFLIYPLLRRRALARNAGKPPGYKPGYLKFVDPLFRERLGKIFAEIWEPEKLENYEENIERMDTLINRITEPLKKHEDA